MYYKDIKLLKGKTALRKEVNSHSDEYRNVR
jgi:hypothetical protein